MPEVIAKRGKKGGTFFVRYPDDQGLKSTKLVDAKKIGLIDVLLAGKMTVLPPSIHPDTGEPYQWRDGELLGIDPKTLPEWGKEKEDLLRWIIRSEHADAIASGVATHDPGLAFTAGLVRRGYTDEAVESIFKALLPPDYPGNSLTELKGWIRTAREKGFDQPESRGDERGRKSAPGQEFVESLEKQGVTFCHDQLGRGYMTVPTRKGGFRTFLLGSQACNDVIQQRYYEATGGVLRESSIRDIVALLRARARFKSPEEVVYTRIARRGDSVIVDLGTSDGSVVVITADDWKVELTSPVRFARPAGMMPLPVPRLGAPGLQALKSLLGLDDATFTLLLAFVLNCLRGQGPFMCLIVEGEQGSGKSFVSHVARALVDPNIADKVRLPDNERDLMVLAGENFMMVFDNSSGMKANISDLLCSIATGGGFVSRKLYTDADVSIIQASRPFIINGISDVASRPDLLERAIPLQLERMDDEDRKTESEMVAELKTILPDVLGELYATVACALRNESETEAPKGLRMADVGRWLIAAEPATGLPSGGFMDALQQSQADRIIERTNNEPIVVALRTLLKEGPFEGTFGRLLELITPHHNRPRYFPETAVKLAKDLARLQTGMKLAGIHFERGGRGNKGQNVRAWLDGQENDPPRTRSNSFAPGF